MGLFHLLERSRAAIERINEIKTLENATALLPLQTPKGYAVQFEQVNFSYDADKATLKNIDFSVPQNSFNRHYWHLRLRQNHLTQFAVALLGCR